MSSTQVILTFSASWRGQRVVEKRDPLSESFWLRRTMVLFLDAGGAVLERYWRTRLMRMSRSDSTSLGLTASTTP
ncbi:unnamed protein product [Litomosoides sigmodontis]|uniref:Uncharacterized protein n=1 Tax=Litomosoides sigmodontis TaxID=42156 RepID=A0A3P6TQ80_LITSI|nr:unnamed protein product [Litomosoides sigmodontis]